MASDASSFTLSEAAATRIATIVSEDGRKGAFFRLAVLGGGCSGFQYKFSLDTEVGMNDIKITHTLADGGEVLAVIDEMSLQFVRGGRLDFIDELAGRYFQVDNPQARASCGCGTSFAIA
ncbi:MAG: iron-sulfur cluster assembly accessory protein [Proteobacteria bacterium]|nr:iron-sulfur cluster assembly accessory protein [Pseudomonadota bacterium]